jgi:single-strand DNA-binding protein
MNNTVNLIGHLGQDPDIKSLESGKTLAKFSVATNSKYKNSEGELINDTQWHNIVAWGKTAEIAEKFLKKGSHVAIEGRLNNRQYESSEGETKYVTEVVASELVLLDKK